MAATTPTQTTETETTGAQTFPPAIGEFEPIETGYDTSPVYAAPVDVSRSERKGMPVLEQQYCFIDVRSITGKDGYAVRAQTGAEYSSLEDTVQLLTAPSKEEAVEAMINWLHDHPSPTQTLLMAARSTDAIPRPGPNDRPQMARRPMNNHLDRIRVGSRVQVDNLTAGTVVEQGSPEKHPDLGAQYEYWTCETASGDTFEIARKDGFAPRPITYVSSVDPARVYTAHHLRVSNEQNLRDEIDEGLYEWFKAHEGETVLQITSDTTFEVVEVKTVRDGFVNPTDKGALTADHRVPAKAHVTAKERGNWAENPFDIEPGTYTLRGSGVVRASDTFGVDPVVPLEDVAASDLELAVDDATPARTSVDHPTTADRTGLNTTDSITELTGVGPATAEQMYRDTIGDLLSAGFPAPQIPTQYTEKAISDLYTLTEAPPTPGFAARAVVGILGGVGYDTAGESVGTAASMLLNDMDPDRLVAAWLGHQRIKDTYVPGWITDDNGSLAAFGAGPFGDVANAVRDHRTLSEGARATAIHRHGQQTDHVAVVAPSDAYVTVPEKALRTAGAIIDAPIGDGTGPVQLTVYPHDDDGDGVVVLSRSETDVKVILDTSGLLNPDALRETLK